MIPKGILKSSKFQSSKQSSTEASKSIVWDDPTIQKHDLERGTRQKIDEPKTPYIHYEHETDEILSDSLPPSHYQEQLPQEQLEQKVQAFQPFQQVNTSNEMNWSSDEEQQDKKQEQVVDLNFVKKRNSHYQMGNLLKNRPVLDDDEEEEEEEDSSQDEN